MKEQDSKESCRREVYSYLCLLFLTLQNAAYTIILKYVFLQDKIFITTTAICLSEVLKVFCSLMLMMMFEKPWTKIGTLFYNSVMKTPLDTCKMCIPAIAYVVMNNLSYTSNKYLDVITFQIISQLKIPMTVFFSIILLRSTYRRLQFLSIIVLTIGVVTVQYTDSNRESSHKSIHSNITFQTTNITTLQTANITIPQTSNVTTLQTNNVTKESLLSKYMASEKFIGYTTGIAASVISGYAGVYFEKILKTTTLSVWARNAQLSLISVPLSFVQTYTWDYSRVKKDGFFYGYYNLVWIIIVLQATSGLTVALSVKLTDNVSKGYATSASILLSGFISTIIFHYRFDYFYACGAALVILSIPMYTFSFSLSTKILPEKIDYEGKECYI